MTRGSRWSTVDGYPSTAFRTPMRSPFGHMASAGSTSNGWYLLFEVGGLLLLSAVVGAVLLAKRHLDTPVEGADHDVAPVHGHGGHADRGTAIAMLHDQASGSTSTTLAHMPTANMPTDSHR